MWPPWSAAQRLLYHHAVAPPRRVAVVTANAEGYAAALDALAHGMEVAAVLDLRNEPGPLSKPLADQLHAKGVSSQYGVRPVEAVARAGGDVGGLVFESGTGGRHKIDLDGVWMSVGFAPANALLHQASTRMSYSATVEQFVPRTLPPGVFACGKV